MPLNLLARHPAATFAAAITLYLAWRLPLALSGVVPLYPDEAQYALWAREPDLGYFSKPPLVAWLIAAATALLGDGVAAVRLLAAPCYALAAAGVYLVAAQVAGQRCGLLAGLLFLSSPLSLYLGGFMTTDAPLLACYAWTLAGFLRALADDRWSSWLATGFFAGLGLLAKYSMGLFALAALLTLVSDRHRRSRLTSPRLWSGVALAALLFSPNLLWNARHDFVSFGHTAEISQLDRQLLNPEQLVEFLLEQLLVFGPLALPGLLLLALAPARWRDPTLRPLLLFALVFLGIIALQSLLARAFENWAAPAYLAGSAALAVVLVRERRPRLASTMLASNLLIGLLAAQLLATPRVATLELGHDLDLHGRVRAGPAIAEALRPLAAPGAPPFVFDDRKTMATQLFYLPLALDRAGRFDPRRRTDDYFRMRAPAERFADRRVRFVSRHWRADQLGPYLEDLETLAHIDVRTHPDHNVTLTVFEGRLTRTRPEE